jgi:hypothetical protein
MSALLIFTLCLIGSVGAETRVCGTQWLKEHRADRHQEGRAKELAPQQQIHGDIEVGTQLQFRGNPFSLVAATCQYVGEHAYIFVEDKYWDTNGGLVFQNHVDQLGSLFDHATPADAARGIYQINTEVFGPVPDIDGYERVFVLVLRVRDYIATSNVVGFFDPEVPNEATPALRLDTIYLDEETVRRNAYLAQGTLAHEFQHLIHWGQDADEDSWVDEGLSGYAELINGFPETDPTMVPNFLDNPDLDLTLWLNRAANYGSSYLFMAMLAERYGEALIGQLVAETRNGIFGIEGIFDRSGIDEDFRSVWGNWVVGNYAPDDPRYGYTVLQGRRVRTFFAPEVPFTPISGNVTTQWGTSNIQFRVGGNIAVEFAGEETGRFRVWLYSKQGEAISLQELTLDAANRGEAEVLRVDSLAVIVGRTSPQGKDFTLAAREVIPTDVAELVNVQPRTVELGAVYPNPFNGYAIIPFDVPDATEVELSLYNNAGQQVRVLRQGMHGAGRYEVVWNGLDEAGEEVASGMYQAVLQVGERRLVRKLSLVK